MLCLASTSDAEAIPFAEEFVYNYFGNYSMLASQQATTAESEAFDAQQAAHDLGVRVDHLEVACRAMWSFIEASQKVTLQDLAARMLEVEKQHPAHEGVVTCAQCHRPTGVRHGICMYCGAPLAAQDDPFSISQAQP
jgi:hypothetical protein